MMDPIFGLPCINESRAMDNARNRNYVAEKNLAMKFESLDLAKRSASDRLLTNRCGMDDFLESLDLSVGKFSRRGNPNKRMIRSMSLRELDKRITEAKDRKNPLQSPLQIRKFTKTASNPNSAIVLKRENTVLTNTFDSNSRHIVHLEEHPRCLPINRQKHAMRDAYERATTEDVHHKRQRAPMPSNRNQSPKSFSPHLYQHPQQKGHDKLSCDSPVPFKYSNAKQLQDRKKPT